MAYSCCWCPYTDLTAHVVSCQAIQTRGLLSILPTSLVPGAIWRYAKARHRSADSCPNAVALSRKSCFKEADRCVGLFPVPPETCGANSPIFDDSHSQDFELPPRASRATGSLDSPIPWPFARISRFDRCASCLKSIKKLLTSLEAQFPFAATDSNLQESTSFLEGGLHKASRWQWRTLKSRAA